MNWQKIRVHRYTRELHPEDHKEGLPSPGELDEDPNNYELWHVKQVQSGDWVGRNGIVNNWLLQAAVNKFKGLEAGHISQVDGDVQRFLQTEQLPEDAKNKETQAAELLAKSKATRKQGRKRKAL